MSFSAADILNEFVEAAQYAPPMGIIPIDQWLSAKRARDLQHQRNWAANPANREKKRLAMIAYRAERSGEGDAK